MVTRDETRDDKTDPGRIAADIEQLKADLAKLSETLVGLGRDGAAAVKNEGAELRGAIEGQIKERPLLALLAAFGLGLVVSRLIDRR